MAGETPDSDPQQPDAAETPQRRLRYMLPPDYPSFHTRIPEVPSTGYGGISFVTGQKPFAREAVERARKALRSPRRPATDEEVRAYIDKLKAEGVLD